MPINRPYRRTCRPFKDGRYASVFTEHPQYAQSPEHYVRACLLLLKDLRDLFDYVEPADKNLGYYSYRIHSLLLRACVEVEANCKALLKENGYSKKNKKGDPLWLRMDDDAKIERSHRLSDYQVKVPQWSGVQNIRTPLVTQQPRRRSAALVRSI
jgi:hypothetical protein